MAGKPYFPPVPNPPPGYTVQWANRAVEALNVAMSKINNGAVLTLADGAASTVMRDARLSAFSVLTFMATTANAAAIAGSIWVDGKATGVATVHHANTANTDQIFEVGIHA